MKFYSFQRPFGENGIGLCLSLDQLFVFAQDECRKCLPPGKKTSYCSDSCKTPSYVDECGACQSNGSEVSVKDCNNDCSGKAKPVSLNST